MDIQERNRLVYMSEIYISAMFAGLAVRSTLLGVNDRLYVFYMPALLAASLIIINIIKSVMRFSDICMFAILFSGCFYTAVRCSGTLLYMAAMAVTMLLLFVFIGGKLRHSVYAETPAGKFEAKMFILKILHFIFVFSILFIGMESVTIFSAAYSLLSILFINLLRNHILHNIKKTVLIGEILELLATLCMILIMPRHSPGNIVEFQMENTMGIYINRFLCVLILSLLEIPFNPVWSFEKNLKG